VITVTDMYKSFPMGGQTLTVLKGVNLQIQRGELIAIVGASGAGKSTLLHIIGTLDRPCRRTIKCPDNMEQRALSSSRSPDNRNQLPPLNLQIDALQHREGLPAHRERFVQIGDGDHAGAPE
jgi:ABC-type lipoprotein export system ATPase subunit